MKLFSTKTVKVLLSSFFILFALTACGPKDDKTVIIKVDGINITKGQYNEILEREERSPQYQMMKAFAETDIQKEMFNLTSRAKIVNMLIMRTLLEEEIDKRGITVSKEEIAAARDKILDSVGSEEKLNELLKQAGVSKKQFEKDLEIEVKTDKLAADVDNSEINDDVIEMFYNSNKEKFYFPERVRVSHILIKFDPVDAKQEIIQADKKGEMTSEEINNKVQAIKDEKMKLAQEIRAKVVKDPKQFAAVAKEFSEDADTAKNGGDVGFNDKTYITSVFSEDVFNAKPGVISEIITTDNGFEIVVVTDRSKEGQQTFAEAKESIKAFLEQNRLANALSELLQGLQMTAKIEYIDPDYDLQKIQFKLQQDSEKLMTEQEEKNKEGASDKEGVNKDAANNGAQQFFTPVEQPKEQPKQEQGKVQPNQNK